VFSLAKKLKLTYKGFPLRRKDNLIYFGSMADKYIAMLQILETKKVQDLDVPSRIAIQLQLTDPDLKSRDRVVKKSEKTSLYDSIDLAYIWLSRALST
jgi:arginyl-tRNA synthetase